QYTPRNLKTYTLKPHLTTNTTYQYQNGLYSQRYLYFRRPNGSRYLHHCSRTCSRDYPTSCPLPHRQLRGPKDSYKRAQIMHANQNAILQIQSCMMVMHHSHLEIPRTVDDHKATKQIKNDYLRDIEGKLQSYARTIDELRSLLHELQQLHNSFSAVLTNPTLSKPESKEKDLIFPKDLSKFGEVSYRNAQAYILMAAISLQFRCINIDNPKTLASYPSMVIWDDKKRNEYAKRLFTLEESGDMTADDVHKLFLRVRGTMAQTVTTWKEILEMQKRPDETYHESGSHIELQVKCTRAHDKTPAIISHLFSDAPLLARTDLKLQLLVRDLYKHSSLPFPDAKLISLSDLMSANQFLESPTRFESMNLLQAPSGYKNKSRPDNKCKPHSGSDSCDDPPWPARFKGSPDHFAQKDKLKKAWIGIMCTNCSHLSNHVTKNCKAPMCNAFQARHSQSRCPSNNTNATKPMDNATVARLSFDDVEAFSDNNLHDFDEDPDLESANPN
ncbi:hypothetical protein BGX21_004641, partial [Mortierella sp. AD011]